MKFADYFNQRIAGLGLNQSDVARELTLRGYEVSRAAISLWVSGKRNPDISNPKLRESLANILQIDVEQLLELMDYIIPDNKHTSEGRRAAFIIDQIEDENERKRAINVLQALIGG
jgi:transcriptional regulator with XRE-family HTH domain